MAEEENMDSSTYVALGRIKRAIDENGTPEYTESGEEVGEGDFDDFDDLVLAKAVVTKEEYDRIHPELTLGMNQAPGTPSNLGQVTGTVLQANLPDPEEAEEAPTPPPPVNPSDPPFVDGAVTPGENGVDGHEATQTFIEEQKSKPDDEPVDDDDWALEQAKEATKVEPKGGDPMSNEPGNLSGGSTV